MPRIDENEIYNIKQKQICKMKPVMLVYQSRVLCEQLLSVEFDPTIVLNQTLRWKKQKCGQRCIGTRLEGYYILPNVSGQNHFLEFYPVWSMNRVNSSGVLQVTQVVGNAIAPNFHAIGSSELSISGCTYDIVADTNNVAFDHEQLQFKPYFPGFDRAYINYFDLFCIVNNSKFVGIVGARVTSGNFVVDRNDSMRNNCDKQYFTYRFVGFTKANCSRGGLIALAHAGRSKNKDGSVDPQLPAETWAVPCPPRWT